MADKPAAPPPATPPTPPRKRVSIDAEVWQHLDRLLLDLPFRTAAPIVNLLQQTGGVQDA